MVCTVFGSALLIYFYPAVNNWVTRKEKSENGKENIVAFCILEENLNVSTCECIRYHKSLWFKKRIGQISQKNNTDDVFFKYFEKRFECIAQCFYQVN